MMDFYIWFFWLFDFFYVNFYGFFFASSFSTVVFFCWFYFSVVHARDSLSGGFGALPRPTIVVYDFIVVCYFAVDAPFAYGFFLFSTYFQLCVHSAHTLIGWLFSWQARSMDAIKQHNIPLEKNHERQRWRQQEKNASCCEREIINEIVCTTTKKAHKS